MNYFSTALIHGEGLVKTLSSVVAGFVLGACVVVVHVIAFGEFPCEDGIRDLLRER